MAQKFQALSLTDPRVLEADDVDMDIVENCDEIHR